MHEELKRLREQRNKIIADMQALHLKAEKEKRGFNADEDSFWAKGEADLVTIEARIRRVEALDGITRPQPSTMHVVGFGEDRAAAAVHPTEEWRNAATGELVRVLERDESCAAPNFDNDHTRISLGAYARALVIGPRTETERRALSEGTASAGGNLVPSPLANEVIDRLRAQTVVFRAGARTVLMDSQTLKIAKLTGDSTASWLAEGASMSSSDPTFGAVTLTAKTLRCLVVASREVVEDAPNFDEVLRNMLASAFAVELDRAALLGSGTGAEPQGLVNQSGVGAVANGANGAVLANYDQWTTCVQTLAEANSTPASAWIMAPRTQAQQARYKATDNQVLVPHAMVSSIPSLVTSAIPVNQTVGTSNDCSTVFVGDFRQMLIGLRSEFSIRVLQERYADTHQVGFVASLRADVQLAQPAAFVKMTGVRA